MCSTLDSEISREAFILGRIQQVKTWPIVSYCKDIYDLLNQKSGPGGFRFIKQLREIIRDPRSFLLLSDTEYVGLLSFFHASQSQDGSCSTRHYDLTAIAERKRKGKHQQFSSPFVSCIRKMTFSGFPLMSFFGAQCGRPGFDPQIGKITWRRAWEPTPVFLLGGSPGQRSLPGYSPWGSKESDKTKATGHAHTQGRVPLLLGNNPVTRLPQSTCS